MSMPLPKNPDNSTREKLLQLAERLFAEKGFYGTSIGRLASELGIAKASVMHHFPSKGKLYGEVLARLARDMEEKVAEPLRGEQEIARKSRLLIVLLVRWTFESEGYSRLMIREMMDNAERVKTASKWLLAPVLSELYGLVQKGQEAGVIRPMPPAMFLEIVMGTCGFHLIDRPSSVGNLGQAAAEQLWRDFPELIVPVLERALLNVSQDG